MTTKQNIEKVLWNACDSFRGKIDSSRYKDYILSMLFVDHAQKSRQKIKENHRPNWEASHYYANEGGESYKSHGYT